MECKDEKPITARQCIQALARVGLAKPQYIPQILSCFHNADLSKYKDSMRPLIEKDMAAAEDIWNRRKSESQTSTLETNPGGGTVTITNQLRGFFVNSGILLSF